MGLIKKGVIYAPVITVWLSIPLYGIDRTWVGHDVDVTTIVGFLFPYMGLRWGKKYDKYTCNI